MDDMRHQFEQIPVARVTGCYGGRCIIEPNNRAAVLPTNMPLYTTPHPISVNEQLPVAWRVGTYLAQTFADANVERQLFPHLPIIPLYAAVLLQSEQCSSVIRNSALEEAATLIENGSFLHDKSPSKILSIQVAKAIRAIKTEHPTEST